MFKDINEIHIFSGGYYPSLADNFRCEDLNLSWDDDDVTGRYFYGYTRHIDNLVNVEDILARLFSIQTLLNGALRVNSRNIKEYPTIFSEVYLGAGSEPTIASKRIEEFPFDNSYNHLIDQELEECRAHKVSRLITYSRKSQEIRSLLLLLGLVSTNTSIEAISTWNTLYKILDSVKHYSKELHGNNDLSRYGDTKKVSDFTAACNNMSVIGIYARHGASSNAPPTRYMSDIEEAMELVSNICFEFIEDFLSIKDHA